MNVILGSGLIGLTALSIHKDYTIVPIAKSTTYSMAVPIFNDYINIDDTTSQYLSDLGISNNLTINTSGFSYAGQLTTNEHLCLNKWLNKIYSNDIPPQAYQYVKQHMVTTGLCQSKALYDFLYSNYKNKLLDKHKEFGKISKIDLNNHLIELEHKTISYDKLIVTIPFDAFCEYSSIGDIRQPKPIYCYHLRSNDIDLEKYRDVYVVDENIDFYKVSQINSDHYIFYSTKSIEQPGEYFMGFIKSFDLINETIYPNGIHPGRPNKTNYNKDITLIGSASWDDFLDPGSCIKRLMTKI